MGLSLFGDETILARRLQRIAGLLGIGWRGCTGAQTDTLGERNDHLVHRADARETGRQSGPGPLGLGSVRESAELDHATRAACRLRLGFRLRCGGRLRRLSGFCILLRSRRGCALRQLAGVELGIAVFTGTGFERGLALTADVEAARIGWFDLVGPGWRLDQLGSAAGRGIPPSKPEESAGHDQRGEQYDDQRAEHLARRKRAWLVLVLDGLKPR